MKNIVKIKTALLAGSAFAASAVGAQAQETGSHMSGDRIDEIVVTAQKREQAVDDVPISITALGGDALRDRGITSTSDLVKAIPGFTVTQTNSLTPVYTLRGVGLSLYDAGVGAAPSVSVYVDEVPLPSPMPVAVSTLDLARVEVLKGPQGTLFGQNATGGAINYVSAKPTDHFAAGGSVTLSRFNKIDASGYVSGPISDTLLARLAFRSVSGGAWQRSVTRPGDKLGDMRELQGKLLLDWQPTEKAHFLFTLRGARDRSDTMAGQFVAATPSVPVLAVPELLTTPAAPRTPRAADWSTGFAQRSNDSYYHVGLRSAFELSDDITLTSLTNYQHVKIDKMVDQDGSAALVLQINPYGYAKTFDQEIRLSGTTDRLTWVVGGNYEHSRISDNLFYAPTHLSFNGIFSGPPFFIPPYTQTLSTTEQKVETYAAFGNVEYKLTDNLTAQAGVRYTRAKRSSVSCTSDPGLGETLSQFINAYQLSSMATGAKTTPFVPIAPNACIILAPPPDLSPTGPLHLSLDEDNVAWRVGLSYQADGGTLAYANVSRGYKAGAIIPSGGLLVESYLPTQQESLTAYEIGVKAPLLDNRVQINAAGFYYDYKDKQVPGTVADPVFVALPGLGNVPKSRVYGIEGQFIARPIDGLSLNLAATYLNTKIKSDYFTTVIQNGVPAAVNARGLELPNTPDFSATADTEYKWGISNDVDAFLGGSMTHVAKTTAAFPANGVATILPAYTLFDLRLGFAANDGKWRIQFWGHNITNKYYVLTDTSGIDSRYRFAGMPATYGVTLSFDM
ncbi:TonB-dependent receptor [Sphingopyxis sp. GW247-27LB]|uniref:TonB-dependent receptor n=1 Tax=Sphingopyxis sp. GW247-27LB TaxID=2012632 RepID=UPI000BA5B4E0|nr:TonB-dependent receptor [Sphingopyxis sp. GW247-27LB]PAL24237.1 TonB-dependent receptor [Sphingopyxis sp. GW247-27LB]